MKNVSKWTSVLCLSAVIVFAERPPGAERPVFDPARSGVQVLFAPESREAAVKTAGEVVYAAPSGTTGMLLGNKFMVGTFITIGSDGRLQLECAPLAEAVRKLEAAKAARQSAAKETSHEK